MLISDIPVGGPISIEISIDNVSYEMRFLCCCIQEWIHSHSAFTSKGAVIDFSSYKDILFNLYTIDPSTQNRVVWKNINIETIGYKASDFSSAYYKISTNVFASIASECDRRFNQRISTEASGSITLNSDNEIIPVTLIDVCNKGLSFSINNKTAPDYNNIYITFSDIANGKQFNFHFKCVIIRSQISGERCICGCVVPRRHANILHMFFLKRLNIESTPLKNRNSRTLLKMLPMLLLSQSTILHQDFTHIYHQKQIKRAYQNDTPFLLLIIFSCIIRCITI